MSLSITDLSVADSAFDVMTSTRSLLIYFAAKAQSLSGGPQVILNLVQALASTTWLPIVVVPQENLLSQALRSQKVAVEVLTPPKVLITNDSAVKSSWSEKLGILGALETYHCQLADLGRRYQVQGIWCRNVKSVLLTHGAAKQLQVPLIWDIGLEKTRSLFWRGLLQWGLWQADAIVMEAACQRQDLFGNWIPRFFAKKIRAIAPGISEKRIRQIQAYPPKVRSHSSEPYVITCIGSINNRKNQLGLLQAVAALNRPEIQVQLVGGATDEAYGQTCQDFVEQTPELTGRVSFLGWREDVPELMSQSDLLVLPSRGEGIPYVIHEAMHAGLPIVATTVGGIPDALSDRKTARLVSKDDPLALQQAIADCLDDPDAATQRATQAQQFAREKFAIAAWSKNYLALLENLCAKAG
ncbi:MAG: glycosyltransferase family 4 protein [Cyanobacteria bacterium P01_H01_bin.15]